MPIDGREPTRPSDEAMAFQFDISIPSETVEPPNRRSNANALETPNRRSNASALETPSRISNASALEMPNRRSNASASEMPNRRSNASALETPNRRSNASALDTSNRRSNASVGTPPRRSSAARRSGHYGNNGYYDVDVDAASSSAYDEEPRRSEELARLSVSSVASHLSLTSGPIHVLTPDSGLGMGYELEVGRRCSRRDRQITEDEEMDMEVGAFVFRKSLSARERPLPIILKFIEVRFKVQIRMPALMKLSSAADSPVENSNTFEKEILHGVTGFVLPGEMLAVLGPSGSGKTSLLSLLGGRVRSNVTGSTITYNDVPFCKALQRRMGFVTQDDVLFPHLTVKETLVYAALLRLPKTISAGDKIQRAEDIIVELGLDRCRDTIIGGPLLRGVSGGERKRVCIGHEIITDPSLLFLDEPTSGLDSSTAFRIIQLLQSMAQAGRTVVTTIHQPSSRLFYMFDKLILMADGYPLYFGDADECMAYFDSIELTPLLNMNPADFLLDLASGNVRDVSIPTSLEQASALRGPHGLQYSLGTGPTRVAVPPVQDVLQYLVECYTNFIFPKEGRKLIDLGEAEEHLQTATSEKRVWSTSWWTQFTVLLVRGLKERRHEYLSTLRIIQIISAALIAGMLWWRSKHKTDRQLQDQVGVIFFISLFWGFFPLFTAIFTFPQERAMLIKERRADMYRLSAYFMSRTLGDLPLDMIMPVVFLIICYFMANLRMTAGAFFLTMLVVFLNVITSQSVGLAIGATIMDVKKATTMASVVLMTFMLSSGFFVQHIPGFIGWVRYVSFNFYTYKLMIKVQYGPEDVINCDSAAGCNPIGESPALRKIHLGNGWKEALILGSMVVIYRVIAYISLRRMNVTYA